MHMLGYTKVRITKGVQCLQQPGCVLFNLTCSPPPNSESLEMKKQECWRFGDALQDAEMRERDVTGTLKEVKDQLKIEVEMQSQLAMRYKQSQQTF